MLRDLIFHRKIKHVHQTAHSDLIFWFRNSSLFTDRVAHSSHILHWRVLGFSDHSGGTSDSALKHTCTSDPFLEVVHRYNLSHFKP